MNILYIHQYFRTPLEPGGTRSYWIAKELVNNGHKVTMLTAKNSNNSNVERAVIEGIDILYINVPYDNNMTLVKRFISFIKFMIYATLISLRQKNIDLVISTSTPLTVGFPALILKFVKKIPYIFEVRDLWPEVPIKMGALKNPFLIKLATSFEIFIYKNAAHIVALSPGMEDGIRKTGIDQGKISMIPNMSKIDTFWPRNKDMNLCAKLGLSSAAFKIIHFGALGVANGAMTIIDSAVLLKNNKKIEFVFVGGGSTENLLKEQCAKENLTNVKFLGKFPMTTTSEIVNLCDVSMVSFMDLPILYTNSPNKLFDSLSAGKPIIVNSAGWTKNLVESYNCGYYVNPKKPQELVDKILFLQNNRKLLDEMGYASRELAESQYDKTILCKKFVDVVNNLGLHKVLV